MTKKIFWMLALVCQLTFMSSGCGEEPAEQEHERADEHPEEPPVAETHEQPEEPAAEEAAEPPAETGGVCDRAQRCCEAYVAEMSSHLPANAPPMTAEQHCAGISQARLLGASGEITCTQQIAAYRQSLTGASFTVPADCAE